MLVYASERLKHRCDSQGYKASKVDNGDHAKMACIENISKEQEEENYARFLESAILLPWRTFAVFCIIKKLV